MLTTFWFTTTPGLGYGVTAHDQRDAEALLSTLGYPKPSEAVSGVAIGVSHADLDQNHVVPNAGPIVIRGVWYPRHNL